MSGFVHGLRSGVSAGCVLAAIVIAMFDAQLAIFVALLAIYFQRASVSASTEGQRP